MALPRQRQKSSDPGVRPRYRRVNITIREDQYALISAAGYSLSGLIRDLVDDRFASSKIVVNLSSEGKKLYDMLVGNFGLHDADLEPFLIEALDRFLGRKVEDLDAVRNELRTKFGLTRKKSDS